MEKIDLKKELPWYRARQGTIDLVNVPAVNYLMVDGKGDPNTSAAFAAAAKALYPVAYKIKFASKKEWGKDYAVMPLEGLWWADNLEVYTSGADRSEWLWTLMIMQPDWVDESMVEEAMAAAGAKNPPAVLHLIRFEALHEGLAVQTLHVGPYADEGPVIRTMHTDFMSEHRLIPTGKHHEVYFSDARKVEPAKLRTILRQPVAAA